MSIDVMAIGDDGQYLVAEGHVNPHEFLEAARKELDAYEVEDVDAGLVEHCYATVGPRNGYDDWWECGGVTADTPGARPITLLEPW